MAHQRLLAESIPASLDEDNDGFSGDETDVELSRSSTKGRGYPWTWILIVLSLCLVSSNLYTFLQWKAAARIGCIRPLLSYSPAKAAIEYEKRTLWRFIVNNVFTGEPREEFDNAWHDLLSPMVIRITKDELRDLGEKSIGLVDGSGFIAEMAAFHELHCIKRIRRHLYLDHYYPNLTESEQLRESKHIDHCLEYWREAAMCRGDSSLATFSWFEGKPFSNQYSSHECINWGKFAAWAESRKVNASDYSLLTQEVGGPYN
ncbi:hypothetical protein MMC30_003806 [Trapelia coarctata]|nr:hypothetical protein [Trapelia coarctata]